jgi:hypothetical protein
MEMPKVKKGYVPEFLGRVFGQEKNPCEVARAHPQLGKREGYINIWKSKRSSRFPAHIRPFGAFPAANSIELWPGAD